MVSFGLNAYHADAAACLVIAGRLGAAAEEERFSRTKHWAGLPTQAVSTCLKQAGVSVPAIDHIAINRNPGANLLKKALYAFSKRPGFAAIRDRLKNAAKVHDVRKELEDSLALASGTITAQVHHVEHHRAHLASSFLVSPFESSAVVSVDGFGDFVSTMVGRGEGERVEVFDRVTFPHSLGLFYLALTQYLGFLNYGDEYKVMGLAAYGKPDYLDALRRVILVKPRGRFELDLKYFLHHSEGVSMTWDSGAPVIGQVFSDDLVKLLGPPRMKEEPVTTRHENIAASLQAMYEEVFFHILNELYDRIHQKTLCLAGGCALNSVANGQIAIRTSFERVYVPPAAGDDGGAIGAAFSVWHEDLGNPRSFVMDRADWGPSFDHKEIREALNVNREELSIQKCIVEEIGDEGKLCRRAAEGIAGGEVGGWFQGRMEWGARALGNRSIVADPRRPEMKEILNRRIKHREIFRPFAPSILAENTAEYFEESHASPFMTLAYSVRQEKRGKIPAPTHVDGTGRLQTVAREANPRYHALISAFRDLTGVPVVLNTSFNDNEPIVCRPEEAIDCF